jgi:hypothetical protein
MTLGDSLPAIRFLPALAGAGEVVIASVLAGEFGGRRFAQALAALAALVAPGALVADNLLSMNAFEPLFWMGCPWLLIRMVKTGDPKLWPWFGILAGFGLENKYSMLIFGAAIVVGLLLTLPVSTDDVWAVGRNGRANSGIHVRASTRSEMGKP